MFVGDSLTHLDAFQHPVTLRARRREWESDIKWTACTCFMSGSPSILWMTNTLRCIHLRHNTTEVNPTETWFSSTILLLMKITKVLPIIKFNTDTPHKWVEIITSTSEVSWSALFVYSNQSLVCVSRAREKGENGLLPCFKKNSPRRPAIQMQWISEYYTA